MDDSIFPAMDYDFKHAMDSTCKNMLIFQCWITEAVCLHVRPSPGGPLLFCAQRRFQLYGAPGTADAADANIGVAAASAFQETTSAIYCTIILTTAIYVCIDR